MKRPIVVLFVLLGLVTIPPLAFADDDSEQRSAAIMEALELPEATQQLREAGVDEEQISEALRRLRQRPEPTDDQADSREEASPKTDEMAAGRAARVLRAEAETASEHGPMENFGEFVGHKLDEGTCGEELADSIRARRENRKPAAAQQRGQRPEAAGENMPERPTDRGEEQRPDDPSGAADERRPEGPDSVERPEVQPDDRDAPRDRGDERPGRPDSSDRDDARERRGSDSPDEDNRRERGGGNR